MHCDSLRAEAARFLRRLRHRHLRLGTILHLVTEACDLTCPHCCRRGTASIERDLSPAELDKILTTLPLLGPLELVILGGGEPFSRADLPELAEVWASVCGTLAVPTNGQDCGRILATTEQLAALRLRRLHVAVSFDGPEAAHDRHRNKLGAWHSARETLGKLLLLARTYPHLCVSTQWTLHPGEVAETLAAAATMAHRYGVGVDLEPLRNGLCNPTLTDPPGFAFELRSQLGRVFELLAGAGPWNANSLLAFEKLRHQAFPHRWRFPRGCPAGRSIAVLYPDGRLAVCESRPPFADLRREGFAFDKVWRGPAADLERLATETCHCTHGCFVLQALAEHAPRRWTDV